MKSPFTFMNLLTALVLVMPALLAAACGGGAPEEREIPVKLAGGKLDPDTIRVGQGDTVTLQIDAAEPGEVHLHGYNIEREVSPDGVTAFTFVADATGRFRITFHAESAGHGTHEDQTHDSSDDDQEIDVGFLEVKPR